MNSLLRFLRELLFDLTIKEPLKHILFLALLGVIAWLFGVNYGVIKSSVSRFFDSLSGLFETVSVQKPDTSQYIERDSISNGPERVKSEPCAEMSSVGVVKCDTLSLRTDHSIQGRVVTSVWLGDSVELLAEWNPDIPNSVKALYPIYLQTEDNISIPIDQEQVLVLEGETGSIFRVKTADGFYSGEVAKDSVERLGPWLLIKTAKCDSGWVPSDSIEVYGSSSSQLEVPPREDGFW